MTPGYNPEYDPFDDAMTDAPNTFAGRCSISAWTCVLIKGQGKVPYDPQQHQGMKTSTAIEITIEPLDPTRQLIQRDMLNWTADFKSDLSARRWKPSLPGLPRLSVCQEQVNPLKSLNGLWVSGEFVPRPDNKAGETWTTLKFLAVYASEQECRAAIEGPAQPTAPTGDPQRALAAFLPALWVRRARIRMPSIPMIAGNPSWPRTSTRKAWKLWPSRRGCNQWLLS